MSWPYHIVLVLLGTGGILAEQTFIDLTHDLDADAIFWPGIPSLNLTNLFKGETPDGFWLEYNVFSLGEHGGTHMDAPAHFSQNNWHLSDIPVNRFIGPGVVVDISERAMSDPETQLKVEDLQNWEEKHGKIPSNAWVLMNSGWTKKWKDKQAFFGSSNTANISSFRFPSISGKAAKWLWENRPYITGVGVDTASIDSGPSRDYPAHRALLTNKVIALENVANLDKVPASGFMVHAIPIKLKNGSGGPIRLFAVLGSNGSPSSRYGVTISLSALSSVFLFYHM